MIGAPGRAAEKAANSRPPKQKVQRTKNPAVPAAPQKKPQSFVSEVLADFKKNAYVDIFLFSGFSKPTLYESWWGDKSTYTSTPTLIHWGLGGSVGYPIPVMDLLGRETRVVGGMTLDLRYIGQYSALDARVGNHRAFRFNLFSPMIAFLWGDEFIVKGDFQFLGAYRLANDTAEGKSGSYTGTFGLRATGLYAVGKKMLNNSRIYAGGQFETVSFTTRNISEGGEQTLSPSFSLWQAGVTVAYVF